MLIFSAYTFMLLPFCFLFVFSVFTVAFLHTPCYVFVHFVSFHFYFEVTQQRSWSFCLSLNFFFTYVFSIAVHDYAFGFSHSNCFMLAHCLSLSCSNFNCSRLFFLPYSYFMHTKVVQRSI